MKVSIITMACLNDRAGIDPMPTYRALENVAASFSLGDHIYGDGTSNRNAMALGAVEFPRGSGLVLTIPAAVGGVIPTGSLTVTAGGTGYPVSRTNALFFWITDPTTGAATAHGMLTTNGSGVITAATLVYGGRAGDYSHATSRAFTDDVDLYTWSHPKAWAYRSSAVVLATGPMRKFWALPIKRYLAPDDHEAWNGGFPGAYLSKAPATVTTKAQSYAFWQTASDGVRLLIDQDFHNPAWTSPVTPYIPSGLSGLGLAGTEPLFKVRYFYVDITKTGPVAAPCGANNPPVPGTIARVIVPDMLFEKGDYTTGSDDATRNLFGPVQEAWLDAVQASAVAGGVRSICIASSKDRGGQNSDGWWSHVTQWERINTNIQAKNYPTFWVTGDRHVPHAGSWRVANGDAYDLEVVCPTALGATSEAIVRYKQMNWADQSPDVPVMGSVVWDTDAQTATITVHDMATARGRFSVVIPFGQRKASRSTSAAARTIRPAETPFKVVEFRYVGTWASRPTTGLLATERAFFTDVGQGGSEWIWDGSYWVPMAPVVLFRAQGTLAAPLVSAGAAASGTFSTPGNIPAGMFVKPGMELKARANFKRSTATATAQVNTTIGGQLVGAISLAANVNGQARVDSSMYCVTNATQYVELNVGANAAATNAMIDRAVNFANAQSFALTWSSGNVADTYQLLGYSLTLYP